MENCLLIGNGINRCCKGMSWESLLSKIAEKYFISKDTVDSATLAFEQIKNVVLARNINVSSEDFAYEMLEELDRIDYSRYSRIYSQFLALPINNILTTNFDYAIERSLVSDYQYDKYTGLVVMPQETKHSRIRHSVINGKKIFHIHGELGKKQTICLGNVHYAANLSSIMNNILDYDKDMDSYSIKESVFDSKLFSWAQLFFTNNIYIVGLGLYGCDMDLWWLIAYRQQLKLEGNNKINNKIIYYYLYEQKNKNFADCLESMGIEVRELQVNNNWEEAYFKVAENIKSDIGELGNADI